MSVEEEEKKERVPPTYESLLPCLPLSIKNNLEFDDDEIFASDFDYFQLVEALTTVRFMANDSMSTFVIIFRLFEIKYFIVKFGFF